jgi:hypothetical protein
MSWNRITHQRGERFGRLTILGLSPDRAANGKARWHCRCDCGNETTVIGDELRRGRTISCGCARHVRLGDANRTHGCSHRIPEYGIWKNMRRRCSKESSHVYAYYGGRGITVCPEWSSFERFYADIGPRPSPDHSLDRIDNDGPYSPENCRWATQAEQSRNTRRTMRLTHDGRTLSLREWSRETGIPYATLHDRIRRGWPARTALTQPPRH